ncbi:MAG: hypothetical protein KF729_14875 [Sandaracinaceae bacterium]|nr:hypothetical protein [Sandaracinaceae bacterium]
MRSQTSLTLAAALALAGATGCEPTCPDAPGIACRYAGTGRLGLGPDGLTPRETSIYWAMDMEFAPDGTPYFIDWNNHLIRRVNPDGRVETLVGDFVGDGAPDMADLVYPGAPGLEVQLNHPTDLDFDGDGNLIITAWHNHKLRVLDVQTGLVHVMCGRGPGFAGDGAGMMQVRFNQPNSIERADDGTLYILDQRNHRIRRIGPDGMVSTIAGTGMAGYGGDGGPPAEAQLRFEAGGNPEPSGGIELGPDGAIYFSDGLNHRIRRIDLVADRIDTIVGTGEPGYGGDGGLGTAAQINHARDVQFGPDGRLYFADTENHRVRAWDPTTQLVETVVGTGAAGAGEEGQPATEVALDRPMGIAFGPDGALYVADTLNSRYLRIPR